MRKIVGYSLFILFGMLISVLVFFTLQRLKEKQARDERMQKLPNIILYQTDSSLFDINSCQNGQPTLFVHFNSDCHFCVEKAKVFSQHADDFENVNILWVSEERLSRIKNFSTLYDLHTWENTHFLQCEEGAFYQFFGQSSTPTVVLYDADNKLISHIKNNISIEKVLSLLK